MSRCGEQSFYFEKAPVIAANTSMVGPKEAQGPLAEWFDILLEDDLLNQKSWEAAETEMQRVICKKAMQEALGGEDAQAFLGGDLNAQIIATGFAARALKLPFIGLYGACSTFIEGLILGSALISSGYLDNAIAVASSHFCTAERQFRFPLELGTQRTPSAHWTATAAGCALLTRTGDGIRVRSGTLGRIVDKAIKDANHMGAAMAPAVCACLMAHLEDMDAEPEHYDLIVTGDLGWIGRNILIELLSREGMSIDEERLIDCGASLYYKEQDTHAGGSGCGCIAAVGCGYIMKRMQLGDFKRVLLIGSGAMLSPTSTLQAESIPGIAYAVELEA